MTERKSDKSGSGATGGTSSREDRLKAALKANLARRKAQARARKDAVAASDSKPEQDKE